MLCENCHEREAEITLKIYQKGELKTLRVCKTCANKLANAVREIPDEEYKPPELVVKCPNCGLTLRDFRETFLLGCSYCYDHFIPFFAELFERVIHRSSFPGDRIHPEFFEPYIKARLEKLKEELKELTENEEFREAIKVRDKILKLENMLKWIT